MEWSPKCIDSNPATATQRIGITQTAIKSSAKDTQEGTSGPGCSKCKPIIPLLEFKIDRNYILHAGARGLDAMAAGTFDTMMVRSNLFEGLGKEPDEANECKHYVCWSHHYIDCSTFINS